MRIRSESPRFPRSRAFALALLLLALPAVPPAGAQSNRADSLAAELDGLAAFGFTGQVVVSEGDAVLATRAMGVADPGGRAVDDSTRFAVGSVTKSFTGAIVTHLAAQGRLSLDDPLSRWLPDAPNDKATITLRELLSHTGGLPSDAEGVFEDDSRAQVLAATLAEPLARAPGTRFGYSNAGFQLLAAVCENATGVAWPRLVDSLLLAPCGMTHSGAGSAYASHVDHAADGRNEWTSLGSLRGWKQAWAGSGAGDLVTTARDLWRWGRALQGAGPLTRAEIDTLTARRASAAAGLAYGFGLWLPGERDMLLIGGDIPGYHTQMWVERRAPWRIVVTVSAGERWGRNLHVVAAQRALWRIAHHDSTTLPPAPATWPAGRLGALAGDWTLAPSGRLRLRAAGDGLRMEMSGAEAMPLVFGADSAGKRALVEGRAGDIVRAAASRDTAALSRVLLPVERRGWSAGLDSVIARHVAQYGPVRDAVIDGTVELPWLPEGLRTYVRLRSKTGQTDVSFAWLQGGLLDVAASEGRPAPVILPVAPIAEGGLGAWDSVTGALVRITPFVDKKGAGLRLAGGGMVAIARRATAKDVR